MKRRLKKSAMGKFAALPWWLAECEAYRALKVGPRALLAELKLLYSPGQTLFLGVRDAAELLRVDKQTVSAWFYALEVTGFIKARLRGSQHVKERHASVWILTEYGTDNAPATKEFMQWRPGMSFADRPPGEYWKRIAEAAITTPSKARKDLFSPPDDPQKSKARYDWYGQAVRHSRTEAPDEGAICPPQSDRSPPKSPSVGTTLADTVISTTQGAPKTRKPARVAKPPTSDAARAGAASMSQSDPSSAPATSTHSGAKRSPEPQASAGRVSVVASPKGSTSNPPPTPTTSGRLPAAPITEDDGLDWQRIARAFIASDDPARRQHGEAMLAAKAKPSILGRLIGQAHAMLGADARAQARRFQSPTEDTT